MQFALLFVAVALVLDLLPVATRRQQELAAEVVVWHKKVHMYQRKAQWAPRRARWPAPS